MTGTVVIQYGRLRRVVGRPARFGGFVFVPCWFNFDTEPCVAGRRRSSTGVTYPLRAAIGPNPPEILASPLDEYDTPPDAAWVRGRIPAVFRFAPATLTRPDFKYSLVEQPFLACRPMETANMWEAIPFVCVSHGSEVGLAFSPDGPLSEVREAIAAAFWGLMLNQPDVLSTFHDGYMEVDYDECWYSVHCDGYRVWIDNDDPPEDESDDEC